MLKFVYVRRIMAHVHTAIDRQLSVVKSAGNWCRKSENYEVSKFVTNLRYPSFPIPM